MNTAKQNERKEKRTKKESKREESDVISTSEFGGVSMHPVMQSQCEEILNHPLLKTPPPEPDPPPPPRRRRPRVFKFPPKFPLLTDEFYELWCNHFKQLILARHRVDNSPPSLFPELYLQPRRLDAYARIIEANMKVNQDLLKRINLIQRNGGFVDCHQDVTTHKINKLMCKERQRVLNEISEQNYRMFIRLCEARSQQPTVKELNEMWKSTKAKLILGAQLPFILFKEEDMQKGYSDPAFEKPPNVFRPLVLMELVVRNGSKIGTVLTELFSDIAPQATQLFLTLVKGDPRGYAYTGTRIFRIVPGLYCRGGDVSKDCGFGQYMYEGETDPIIPGEMLLKHSVPGVLSMAVSEDGDINGQFNIIFKPLPQFDGKHVVFGRIRKGPAQFLERISALGLKLGTPSVDVVIRRCGVFSRNGTYSEGAPSTIKFPKRTRKESL